jgi:5-methylcytosine-specific restriction enzyme A
MSPMRPGRPCVNQMCPRLNCEEHRVTRDRQRYQNYDRTQRDPASTQFYHSDFWKRLSAQVKREEPNCRKCGKATYLADHIIPREAGGSDDRSNLQGICKACHGAKSRRELNERGRVGKKSYVSS